MSTLFALMVSLPVARVGLVVVGVVLVGMYSDDCTQMLLSLVSVGNLLLDLRIPTEHEPQAPIATCFPTNKGTGTPRVPGAINLNALC